MGNEVHRFSRDKEFSLVNDVLGHGVRFLEASESSSADLFMSVIKELRSVDNSNNLAVPGEGNSGSISVSFLELFSAVLGDGARHEVSLSVNGKSLHLEALEEFHLVHESVKRVSPSFSDSLEEFSLHGVESELGVSSSSFSLSGILNNKSVNNGSSVRVSDNSLFDHIIDDDLDGSFERVS